MNIRKLITRKLIVEGIIYDDDRRIIKKTEMEVLIINDEHDKTLSINDGHIQYTVPAEQIAEYLK